MVLNSETHDAEILLVEDCDNEVELIRHVFRKHHVTTKLHVARDGAEALDYVFGRADAPDSKPNEVPKVILLDLKLPRVSGHQVLKRIKSDPLTQAIPVVILTSSREDRDLADCYRLGANSYLVKPLDFQKFADFVRLVSQYWSELNQPPPHKAAATEPLLLS